METKRRKRLRNALMAVLAVVILAGGILAAGHVKGWFGAKKPADTAADILVERLSGIANMERDGVGFGLEKGSVLVTGDIAETKRLAQVDITIDAGSRLTMSENTELTVVSADRGAVELQLNEGQAFVDLVNCPLAIGFAGNAAQTSDAVFSVDVQVGSCSLLVFRGEVMIRALDGKEYTVQGGQFFSLAESKDGLAVTVKQLASTALDTFNIDRLQTGGWDDLCFTQAELQKVLDDRAAEQNKPVDPETESQTPSADPKPDPGPLTPSTDPKPEPDPSTPSTDPNPKPEPQPEPEPAPKPEPTPEPEPAPEPQPLPEPPKSPTCTIEIRCDTILNNMENLTPGKEPFVPSSGTILSTRTVTFNEGETVFDVLTRVCSENGLQIEYSWTPMYGSYYIEGINNLYEFDCGPQSGWMYKVDGWFPNYGCSSYYLEDGDVIVWCYTCNGLGADVGGPVW